MLTYILIFSCCFYLLLFQGFVREKDKQFFLIFVLTILALISGTRYYLGGSDYYVYKTVYDSIPTLKDFIQNYTNLDKLYQTFGFERGYLFINSLIKTLGFNFYGFTLIHALFFYTCLYQFIKRNAPSYWIMIAIFLYKIFFYNTFISLRQSITIALFLVAIEFIKNNSFIKYIVTIIVASAIHTAALILIPVYFINRVNFTKKKVVILNIIFIPTLVIGQLNIPILSFVPSIFSWISSSTVYGKIENYAINGFKSGLSIFHVFEYFLVMGLLVFNFNKIKNSSHYSNIYIGLFLCLLPIFTIFSGYEILTRIKDYFTLMYGIILGCYSKYLGGYKLLFNGIILIVCMLGLFRFLILFDNGALTEYESYIFKGISIFGDYFD